MQARGPNPVGARRVGAEGWGHEGWWPEGWWPEGWGPEGWGPKGGGPKGGARRVGARRVGGPKFRAFFSLSRHKIRSFLPSLGVSSLNFGGVFEGRDPQMCTFGLSGCRVKPRRLRGRRGFTRQPDNSKRAHLSAPAFKNNTKIQREDTQRGKKRMNFAAGEGKKERNFGRSRGRAVRGRPVRGRPVRGRAVQGKGGPGEGRSKPNLETNTHT